MPFEPSTLPVVDYSILAGGGSSSTGDDDKHHAAAALEKQKLFHALRDVGFVYLRAPTIFSPSAVVDPLFARSRQFFALPASDKESVLGRLDRARGPSQGYSNPTRFAANPARADLKEFFGMYRDDEPDAARANQWPAALPELRADVTDFFDRGSEVVRTLLGALAEQVGLRKEALAPLVEERNHFVALLYYPEAERREFKERVRASEHTDYGCMTLLFNDSGKGLQVKGKDGEWHYVPRKEGCAVVNVGDLLSRLFNGMLASTLHRVVEPPAPRRSSTEDPETAESLIPARYSIAFFGHFNADALIGPIPECVSKERPKQFDAVVSGEHVKQKVRALHVKGNS